MEDQVATYTKGGDDITVRADDHAVKGYTRFTLTSAQRAETWPDLTRGQAHEVLGDQWGVSYSDRCALLDGFDVLDDLDVVSERHRQAIDDAELLAVLREEMEIEHRVHGHAVAIADCPRCEADDVDLFGPGDDGRPW